MHQGITKSIELAPGKTLSIETGKLAKQADGAVVVRLGDTMALCTAVMDDRPKPDMNFFPLTVDYRENFASGGRIPGGFMKREGRSNDKEILTSRLVDRAVRPLFPDGFRHETQIICFVVSADDENDADILAGVGASAALLLGGAPFDGPIAEVRVGRVDGEFVINPTIPELESSDINLVVAGKQDAIVMVEGEMDEISEEEMVEALDVAHDAIRKLCALQEELLAEAGTKEPFEYTPYVVDEALVDTVRDLTADRMREHVSAPYEKESFYGGIDAIKADAVDELLGDDDTTPEGYTAGEIKEAVSKVEKEAMRAMIVEDGRRIDGRSRTDVRDIWSETKTLPRAHGSSVFTRGETQVLAAVTLGTSKDVQPVDQIFDQEDKRFFLHYRFPPFCVGEARYLRGPGRREIGHGMLAERALQGQLPDHDAFPYTIRINADVLESNGSSSMASVCSGSLALMDAGVPVKKPVAGIAMGLIQEGDETAILTDILGTEDHLGDMDFKLTGTRDGITACQMDIKISGLSRQLMLQALNQARDAREHILDKMQQTLPEPRQELSPHAPRLTQITIDSDFIGAVIGPGGKVIKGIQADTGASIDIDERDGMGYVTIAAADQAASDAAIERIKNIVTVPEAGEDYEGTVKSIKGFGAIIEIMPGREGLLHISEIDHDYVDKVEDYMQVGDKVKVRLTEVRNDGKLRLSRKPFVSKSNGSR
ncbi:MAG: polyribonucleotide nucleotidyltransferase [Bacteroidetes bacterium]|jgi:polyribonucleotide nucleotidyltransferase|nr:polyribonucleotide nucleotidyltransferase [Bacteroidota bacterium]